MSDPKEQPTKADQVVDGKYIVRSFKGRNDIYDAKTNTFIKSVFKNTGSPAISDYIKNREAAGKKVQYAVTDYENFGVQHRKGNYGYHAPEGKDLDFNDLSKRHFDWIESDYKSPTGKKGFNAFVEDVKSQKNVKFADAFYTKYINDKAIQETGKPYFTGDATSPYGDDGVYGAVKNAVPRFWDTKRESDIPKMEMRNPALPGPTSVENKLAPLIGSNTPQPQNDNINSGGWWAQDIAKTAVGLTDQVNSYAPSMYQIPITQEDYALLDPSRRIAAQQEMYNKNVDAVQNSYDGQAARGTLSGMSGQTADQVSNDISQVENANVGIYNEVAGRNAMLSERGITRNTELRKRYDDEMAVLNQQEDNSERELKYRNLKNWMNGVDNKMKTDWMETMTPQVNVNRMTGEIGYTGVADDPTSPYAFSDYGGGSPVELATSQMNDMEKMLRARGGYTEEEIRKLSGPIAGDAFRNKGMGRNLTNTRSRFANGLLRNDESNNYGD